MVDVSHLDLHPRASRSTCPFCHGDLASRDAVWECPKCGTRHHRECATENGECAILGCGARALAAVEPVQRAEPVVRVRPVATFEEEAPRSDTRDGCALMLTGFWSFGAISGIAGWLGCTGTDAEVYLGVGVFCVLACVVTLGLLKPRGRE